MAWQERVEQLPRAVQEMSMISFPASVLELRNLLPDNIADKSRIGSQIS
jgi:hypothetical protein